MKTPQLTGITAALLVILAPYAIASSDAAQEQFSLNAGTAIKSHFTPTPPPFELKLELLRELTDKGYILDDGGDGWVDEVTLNHLYDFSISQGLVEPSTSLGFQLGLIPDLPGRERAKTVQSCKTTLASCPTSLINTAPCIAAAEGSGKLSETCYSTINAGNAQCESSLFYACDLASGAADTYSGRIGGWAPNEAIQRLTCDGISNRVIGVTVTSGSVRLAPSSSQTWRVTTAISVNCSGGVDPRWSSASTTSPTTSTMSCPSGYFADTLVARSGDVVDALSIQCKKFLNTNRSSFPTFGGDGGTQSAFSCPSGQYLAGVQLNAFRLSAGASASAIRGIQAVCRNLK